MKNLITSIILIITVITLSGCSDLTIPEGIIDDSTYDTVITEDTNIIETIEELEESEEQEQEYGSTGALNAEDFTLEDMLIWALQDEYAARAEYDYILQTYDVTKPFSNIIKSEETHISLLLPLFETYGFELPEDTSSEHVITINSLEETFDIGVTAEILNISMYNLFLERDDLPDDVRDVFVKLRDASENHLSAFEKNAAKY